MSSPFAIFSKAFFAALYVHGNKFSVCISFSSRQISAGIGIIRLPASDLGVSYTILFPLINATLLFIVSLQFSKSISAFVKASASPILIPVDKIKRNNKECGEFSESIKNLLCSSIVNAFLCSDLCFFISTDSQGLLSIIFWINEFRDDLFSDFCQKSSDEFDNLMPKLWIV